MTTKTSNQGMTSKQFTELLASKGTNNYQSEPRALSSGIRAGKGTGGASDVITLFGGDPESPRGGTMSTVIEWQPYVTINHGSGEIIQHESLWLDTQGYSQAILDIRALQVSAISLSIETSESLDDSAWHEVTSLSTGAHRRFRWPFLETCPGTTRHVSGGTYVGNRTMRARSSVSESWSSSSDNHQDREDQLYKE